MMTPDAVAWCDGSKAGYDRMSDIMLKNGSAIPIKQRPNSLHFRSDPSDVARVEDRTYISAKNKIDAGPTNNWCPVMPCLPLSSYPCLSSECFHCDVVCPPSHPFQPCFLSLAVAAV